MSMLAPSSLRLVVIGLLAAGCTPPVVDIPFDPDQDGLLDDAEAEAGTDPERAGTDGHNDGAEVEAGTDPTDPDDYPYSGGWEVDDCSEGLVATGNSPGSVTYDFELIDQHGEMVRLYDFCDKVVVLASMAFW